jgi:hypothetical protein
MPDILELQSNTLEMSISITSGNKFGLDNSRCSHMQQCMMARCIGKQKKFE